MQPVLLLLHHSVRKRRVRSRSRDSVLDEVKTLSANGYKEVVLTGIHLSSYGIDCDDNLLSLILAIHEVEGIERIRLGSLERELLRKNLHRRSQNFRRCVRISICHCRADATQH